jgi:hypothetical protein
MTGYERYGGVGISYPQEWKTFDGFLSDMGICPPGLTLDRKDGSKNYSAENCRWATRKEQTDNRKVTIWLTHNGKTMCLEDWAKIAGKGRSATNLRRRIKNIGMSTQEALTIEKRDRLGRTPQKYIIYNDMSLPLRQWAEKFGLSLTTLHYRIYTAKLSPQEAFFNKRYSRRK